MLRLIYNHPEALGFLSYASRIRPFTLLSFPKLFQMASILADASRKKVPGLVVELGCWKGGNAAFMAKVSGRETWAFDTFSGVPEPVKEDVRYREHYGDRAGHLGDAREEDAQTAAARLGVMVHTVKGRVEETLGILAGKEIAVLRLDLDLYAPTLLALHTLMPQLANGGYVVIDDYGDWDGVRRACYEFFVSQGISPKIRQDSYGGAAYWRVFKGDKEGVVL